MPLSPSLFGIYIDKLEECLEDACCDGLSLIGMVIIISLYVDYIILLSRSHDDIDMWLKILQDY